MLHAGVKEAAANFAALVVGNDAPNFSAGANLMLLLLEAQEGNWDEIDLMVRAFQERDAGAALRRRAGRRRAGRPDARRRLRDRAARRSRAGGGRKLHRPGRSRRRPDSRPAAARRRCWRAPSTALPATHADLLPFVQRVFETIGFAKVSTSAADARRLGFLRDADRVTMNRERLMADAKALRARARARGLSAPGAAHGDSGRRRHACWPRSSSASTSPGAPAASAITTRSSAARSRTILAGGALPHQTTVSEQYLLDLEREAFLKLCGERKTLERIQHTLKTGKPLRN